MPPRRAGPPVWMASPVTTTTGPGYRCANRPPGILSIMGLVHLDGDGTRAASMRERLDQAVAMWGGPRARAGGGLSPTT